MSKIHTMKDLIKETLETTINKPKPTLVRQKSVSGSYINIETVIPGHLKQNDIICLFQQEIRDLEDEDIAKYSNVIKKERISGNALIKAFTQNQIEKIKEKFEFPFAHGLDFNDLIAKLMKRHKELQGQENCSKNNDTKATNVSNDPFCENIDSTVGVAATFTDKANVKFQDINVTAGSSSGLKQKDDQFAKETEAKVGTAAIKNERTTVGLQAQFKDDVEVSFQDINVNK